MRITMIGLGKMGHAVATRLVDGGHDVTVWNRSPGRADQLVARGAAEASSPAEASSNAEAVFTSLADDAALRAVVSGDEGIAAGLGDHGVLADMSTVSPDTVAEISATLEGRFLASPILGGPSAVTTGAAVYLIGGPRQLYDRLLPAYEALAPETARRYAGDDVRVASTLKVLSNYLLMSGVAVLAELVATAQAAGLPDAIIKSYLEEAPLVAPALRNRLEDIISGTHEGWFPTSFGAKDLRLAEDLARSNGVRLPIADAVKRRYEEAAAQGWATADIGAVVELMRKHA